MKFPVCLTSVLLLAPAVTATGIADRTSLLVDLMRVDSEFNALAQRLGRIEGFMGYMADDAMLVNRATLSREEARTSFQRTDPKGLRLIWGASYADVSAAGDLGYTLGPWQREIPSPDGSTVQTSTGMFLTLWKRQPDGGWKVIVDGIGGGGARRPPAPPYI
jgi:ketosteroid isomerase-like protein